MEHLLTQNSQTIFLIGVLSTFERCGAGNLPILLDQAVKMVPTATFLLEIRWKFHIFCCGNVKFPPDFQQKCGRWNPFLLLGLEVLADSQRHSAQKLIVP